MILFSPVSTHIRTHMDEKFIIKYTQTQQFIIVQSSIIFQSLWLCDGLVSFVPGKEKIEKYGERPSFFFCMTLTFYIISFCIFYYYLFGRINKKKRWMTLMRIKENCDVTSKIMSFYRLMPNFYTRTCIILIWWKMSLNFFKTRWLFFRKI